jgi:hypothetical protein
VKTLALIHQLENEWLAIKSVSLKFKLQLFEQVYNLILPLHHCDSVLLFMNSDVSVFVPEQWREGLLGGKCPPHGPHVAKRNS